MQTYKNLGVTSFWLKFSDSTGRRFSYSRIISALLAERKAKDVQMAETVRAEYGESFKKKFSYWNSKKQCQIVMTDPSKIVDAYHKKRGEKNDEDED